MELGPLMRRKERRMETPQVRFARLDKAKIEKIHELEGFLGTYVLGMLTGWGLVEVLKRTLREKS